MPPTFASSTVQKAGVPTEPQDAELEGTRGSRVPVTTSYKRSQTTRAEVLSKGKGPGV